MGKKLEFGVFMVEFFCDGNLLFEMFYDYC